MLFQIIAAEPGKITLAFQEQHDDGSVTVTETRTLTDEEALDFMHTNRILFKE